MFISTRLVAGLALIAATASPTLAQDKITHVQKIAVQNLDLASAYGRSVLDRQIEAAVHKVCGSADTRNLAEFTDMQRCRTAAREDAHRQVSAQIAKLPTVQPATASR